MFDPSTRVLSSRKRRKKGLSMALYNSGKAIFPASQTSTRLQQNPPSQIHEQPSTVAPDLIEFDEHVTRRKYLAEIIAGIGIIH
jgi:hypothetical protein